MENSKRAKPTAHDVEAASRLKAVWDARPRDSGITQDTMAEELQITQGAVSQYLNGKIPMNYRTLVVFCHRLGIRDTDIRDDLPEQRLPGVAPAAPPSPSAPASRHETPPGYVRFQLLEGAGGMGDGVVNDDYPEVIREVEMAAWEVRRKIGFLPTPGRIALMTGRGPSMRPMIDHGDVVMVDTSVTGLDGDGVYVVNIGGETQIKMMQKRDDGLWVVSKNPDYPSYRVAEGSVVHFGGKVVATLGVREL